MSIVLLRHLRWRCEKEMNRVDAANKLLKAEEVAKRLNISKSLAYRLMQKGDIRTIRINSLVRVSESDLNEFILKNRSGEN